MYVCGPIEGDLVRGNRHIYLDLLNLHNMTDILRTSLVEGMCVTFDFGLQMAVFETSD
jgi:hypothetical protein